MRRVSASPTPCRTIRGLCWRNLLSCNDASEHSSCQLLFTAWLIS